MSLLARRSLPAMAFLALAGCGGGDPLDSQTALDLLREHDTPSINIVFNSSPRSDDPRIKNAYAALTDAHVLDCKPAEGAGMICSPGPAGDQLKAEGASDLSLNAGRWVPSTIVSIQRGGRNSASAEVRMSFEPSLLYREFESAFSEIRDPSSAIALTEAQQGKTMRATFQRYDDGWHVESLE